MVEESVPLFLLDREVIPLMPFAAPSNFAFLDKMKGALSKGLPSVGRITDF